MGKKLNLFWVLLCALALPFSARALDTADVLPPGVRAFSLVYVQAPSVENSFNGEGNLESLVRPLNRTLKIQDLAQSDARLQSLRKVLNDFDPSQQLGEKILATNLYSDLKMNEKRYVAALFWGLSAQVSLGVIVPYIERSVTTNFHADTVFNGQAIKQLAPGSPVFVDAIDKLEKMKFDTKFYEDKIFVANGYSPPSDFTAKGLGDTDIETRVNYFDTGKLGLGFRGTLRLPTANHQVDLHNLYDRDFGDNAFSVRMASINSWRLSPEKFGLHSTMAATWYAPASQTLVVPRSTDSFLPNAGDPYQIEKVGKKMGLQLEAAIGANLDFYHSIISLFSSYVYIAKQKDNYSGSRDLDYGRLSQGTDSISHALEGGLELSSISLYLRHQWPVPAKVIAKYVQPIGGRNTLFTRYGRLDAVLFF